MSAMLELNQNWTSVPYESCYPQSNQLPKGKNTIIIYSQDHLGRKQQQHDQQGWNRGSQCKA